MHVMPKSKRNKNSSQKKEKRVIRAQEVENFFHLGHCAGKYAESLANPFSGPADACMPATPAIMSRKVRCFIRTQTTVGSAGVGFACMQPLAANDGAVAAGNIGTAAAYTSTAGYAGPATQAIPVCNPATAGVIPNNHNGDYAIAQFGTQGVQARLVSMGLRVRYAGTELNRGGRVILLEDPEHSDFSVNGITLANLLAFDKAKEHKVGTEWITLCQTGPTMPQEYDYSTSAYTPFGASIPAHYMAAFIQSTANNVFDVEFYWNFEYGGRLVRGKTQSETDDAGHSAVLGAIKVINDNQLDSRHPLVAAASKPDAGQTGKVLSGLVQKYAQKNTSGWITKAVGSVKSGFSAAQPYLKDAAGFGAAVLPLSLIHI